MSRLDQRQLENVLDQLFEKMHKQGIAISNDAKDQIKKEVTSELSNKLTPDDIKNPEVQKKLQACITTYLLGGSNSKDFKNKFDEFNSLINNLKDEDTRTLPYKDKNGKEKDLTLKLKADMALLKTLSHIFNPANPNTPELKPGAFAKKMTDEMKLDAKKNKKEEKKEEEIAMLQKQLEETLRNMYGGDNPTLNGEVSVPIIGPIVGNLFAWTNQSQQDPNALSLIAQSATYNPGKSDPNGLENVAKMNEISVGGLQPEEVNYSTAPVYKP